MARLASEGEFCASRQGTTPRMLTCSARYRTVIPRIERNIPRGIFLSILGITVLYLALQVSILGVVPWREAQNSPSLASLAIERLYGHTAAQVMTVMVLWIALASVFSVLLG